MIRGRDDLAMAKRIVIKAGTSVVSTPDGFPSLSRMADIVEHVSLHILLETYAADISELLENLDE